jgi:hypothetical protein
MTKRIVMFSTLFFLMLSAAALAAQQSQTAERAVSTARTPAESSIPVLSTAPGNQAVRSPERLRHKSRSVTKPPVPLGASKYTALTRKPPPSRPGTSSDIQAPEKSRLEHLRLTMRNNYGHFGWLDLNEIRHVDTKVDYAVFYTATDPSMAWTRAHLKVETGERYLIDFSVGASKETTFNVGVSGGGQKFTLQKGSHHLLLYLDATNTTTTQVMLTSDKADYIFYALDVTRVD